MRNRLACGLLVSGLLALFVLGSAGAGSLYEARFPDDPTDARPSATWLLHNLNDCWSAVLNMGTYGDPWEDYPGMEWPAGEGNSYLWDGRFWTASYGAVTIWPDSVAKWCSAADYGNWELRPSEIHPPEKVAPGPVALEETHYGYDDWYLTYNPNPYGMQAYEENYDWGTPGYNQFIVTNYWITHHTGDLEGNIVPDVPLTGFMVAICGDCDVGRADPVECNLDDMVFYDGHAIWCNDPDATFEYVFDNGIAASEDDRFTYAQNPNLGEDGPWYYYNYTGSDGIPDADADQNGVSDHFTILAKVVGTDTIYAMEPNTGLYLFEDGMPESYWSHVVGDTTYLVVPRNLTYMWDSDSPGSSMDDTGEPDISPRCDGFVCWRLLDYWIKRADGTIERPIDVYGYPIPLAHSWWNWESDPGTDVEKYDYMSGANPDASGQYSGPAYLSDWVGNPGAPEALEPANPGPWPVVHEVPYGLGYPVFDYRFLLTMGYVDLYEGDTLRLVGGWLVGQGLDGAREVADNLLDAYYRGGGWGVPKLPPQPVLFYEAGDGVVHLEWSADAESYSPFGGYRIYRSTFIPSGWEMIQEIPGTGTYSYSDQSVVNGFPYFYAVVAFDDETGVESVKSNYKQTIQGSPLEVVPCWVAQSNLDNVRVVPNPYRGSVSWEQTYFDKIAFTGLPAMCDIYIYTLGGDHVATLEHRSYGGDSGTEFWDLVSRNDQEVMSGLYVFRIETEDDHYIGKFAIIK
ncbi:fibronectin type III domain-containing protein [Candidatus Fermentibacterales bacterium]|nr:fibronectin type III domain-containing protein [Candidatus Fermentibacterales bacterium]